MWSGENLGWVLDALPLRVDEDAGLGLAAVNGKPCVEFRRDGWKRGSKRPAAELEIVSGMSSLPKMGSIRHARTLPSSF